MLCSARPKWVANLNIIIVQEKLQGPSINSKQWVGLEVLAITVILQDILLHTLVTPLHLCKCDSCRVIKYTKLYCTIVLEDVQPTSVRIASLFRRASRDSVRGTYTMHSFFSTSFRLEPHLLAFLLEPSTILTGS